MYIFYDHTIQKNRICAYYYTVIYIGIQYTYYNIIFYTQIDFRVAHDTRGRRDCIQIVFVVV